MEKKWIACALSASIALAAAAANADTVTLKSGDVFSGTIAKITPQTVEVDTTFAGKITVKRDTIKTLRSEERVSVVNADGTTSKAFIAPVAEGPGWREQDVVAPPPVPPAPPVAVAAAPAAPAKVYDMDLERFYVPIGPNWKNQFSVGLVNTTGNTESTNIAAELNFHYDVKPLELTFKIGGVYDTTEGKQTAGQFYFDAVYRRALAWDKEGKWYAFGENHELYDAIKKISYRVTNGVGLGYYVVKDPKGMTLDLRAGPAYVCEKFFDGDTNSAISGLVGLRAVYVVNDRLSLSQEALYTTSLEDSRSYQLMSETAALLKLPEVARGVGLKFGFRDDYDNASAAAKRNDTRLTISLTLDF